MTYVLLFTLFALSLASLVPLDLHPLINGLSDTPAVEGLASYWTVDTNFAIHLDDVTLDEGHLWEIYVRTQTATSLGAGTCEWHIDYEDVYGGYHRIKHGFIGGAISDGYGYYTISSSIAFLRYSDVPENAVVLKFRFHHCEVGRFITRWMLEAWNGEAYVLDLSDDAWFDTSIFDESVRRISDKEALYDYYYVSVHRDTSMTEQWSEFFYVDDVEENGWIFLDLSTLYVTPHLVTTPVLELYYYGQVDTSNYLEFYVCDDCIAEDWMFGGAEYFAEIYHSYWDQDDAFGRVYIDVQAMIDYFEACDLDEFDPCFDDNFWDGVIGMNGYSGMALPPYARVWQSGQIIDTDENGPILFNMGPRGVGVNTACDSSCDECYNAYYDYSDDYDILPMYRCEATSFTVVIPESITNLNSPFVLYTDILDGEEYVQMSIIVGANEVIHEFDYPGTMESTGGFNDHLLALNNPISGTSLTWSSSSSEYDTFSFVAMMQAFGSPMPMCEEDTCGENGDCYEYLDTYVCLCHLGYTGESPDHWGNEWTMDCDINIDDCASAEGLACFNDAECVDGENSYTCECADGYEGERCERVSACLNGGISTHSDTGVWGCACEEGVWEGDFCETATIQPACSPNPCENNGACEVDENEDAVCHCTGGFTGEFCTLETCSTLCETQRAKVLTAISAINTVTASVVGVDAATSRSTTAFTDNYTYNILKFYLEVQTELYGEEEIQVNIQAWVDAFNTKAGVTGVLVHSVHYEEDPLVPEGEDGTLTDTDLPDFSEFSDFYDVWVFVDIDGQSSGLEQLLFGSSSMVVASLSALLSVIAFMLF